MKGNVQSRLSVCQVTPVDPEEVRQMTANLRNNPTSDLEKMFQQGDPKTVTEFITTVSAMLNSDSKTSQTGACRMLCCFLLTPRSRRKNKTNKKHSSNLMEVTSVKGGNYGQGRYETVKSCEDVYLLDQNT